MGAENHDAYSQVFPPLQPDTPQWRAAGVSTQSQRSGATADCSMYFVRRTTVV